MAEQMEHRAGPAGSGRAPHEPAPSSKLNRLPLLSLKQRRRRPAGGGLLLLLLLVGLQLLVGDLWGRKSAGDGSVRRNRWGRLEAALCLRNSFVVVASAESAPPQLTNTTHIQNVELGAAVGRQQGRLQSPLGRPNEMINGPEVGNGRPELSVNSSSTSSRPLITRAGMGKVRRHAADTAAQQEVEGASSRQTTTMTNDVLCNSRCKCLQLEFVQRRPAGGGAEANASHLEANNNNHDKPTLNQIALIEFSQDYSFDDDQEDGRGGHAPLPASLEEAEQADGDRAGAGSGGRGRHLVPAESASELAEAAGSGGASVPLVWLPQAPPAPPSPFGGSNLLAAAKLDAGSGDRATIKPGADQSSGHKQVASKSKATMIDQLRNNGDFERRLTASQLRNLRRDSGALALPAAPPAPINGHALLLPPFKQQQQQVRLFKQQEADSSEGQLQQRLKAATLLNGHEGLFSENSTWELVNLKALKELDLSEKKLSAEFDQDEEGKATPLRSSNSSSVKLIVESLRELADDCNKNKSKWSLSLRNNNLKFEVWTQLYSLLLVQMRAQLYRLDLSHNALVKLGVTFTGYIEHHFVYQLMRSNGSDTSWPFARANGGGGGGLQATQIVSAAGTQQQTNSSSGKQNASSTTSVSNYLKLLEPFKLAASGASEVGAPPAVSAAGGGAVQQASGGGGPQARSSLNMKRLFRRPILGDGALYNAVRRELPLELISSNSALGHLSTTDNSSTKQQLELQLANLHGGTTHETLSSNLTSLVQLMLHQPAQVRALDLSHNKLKWLINDQFRILKHVQSIRLDHNRIRFIHQQAFNGLLELKYLNLNYNRLQTIYMEQFQTNYKLQALFMKANYLSYLRAGALASQTNLQRLELSRNKLTILSSNAFIGLESLEWLNLSANSLVHVPSAAFHPLIMSLKQLDLSDNQLAQLTPGAFFHFSQLERISLNDNDQLVSVERGAFWDLPRLLEVSLRSSSQLAAINQQAFVGVPQLKTIQVDDCPLLDSQARKMLENITAANTMRSLLKQQQQQQISLNATALASAANVVQPPGNNNNQTTSSLLNLNKVKDFTIFQSNATTTNSTTLPMATNEIEQTAASQPFSNPNERRLELLEGPSSMLSSYQQQMSIQLAYDQTSATNKITKYFYSLGALVLLVAALKLVFHYTSTSHYLNLRRRRRRVYQATSSSSSSSAGAASPSSGSLSTSGAIGRQPSSETDLPDEDGEGEQLDLNEMVPPVSMSRTSRMSSINCDPIGSLSSRDIHIQNDELMAPESSTSTCSMNGVSVLSSSSTMVKTMDDGLDESGNEVSQQQDISISGPSQATMIEVDLSCPDCCLNQCQAMDGMQYGVDVNNCSEQQQQQQASTQPGCCTNQPPGLCSLGAANCAHCYQSLMVSDPFSI